MPLATLCRLKRLVSLFDLKPSSTYAIGCVEEEMEMYRSVPYKPVNRNGDGLKTNVRSNRTISTITPYKETTYARYIKGKRMKLNCNCCDGIYSSFDVHFTSTCDNKCAHCVDLKYKGKGISKPDVNAIVKTVVDNQVGIDDVLFLGGEPCLYLDELLDCAQQIREKTKLKIYVTTSVPWICYNKSNIFYKLIEVLDGINLSVQHHDEAVADKIRRTTSRYDRQAFYASLPYKNKIRINLNIVKPFLYGQWDIEECLNHYDSMGFNSIKLSEIQHGKDVYVSFHETFGLPSKSAYAHGCQEYLDMEKIIPCFKTPVLLKRSCFLCEESLKASLADGAKMLIKAVFPTKNKYGVIYEDGTLAKGWI